MTVVNRIHWPIQACILQGLRKSYGAVAIILRRLHKDVMCPRNLSLGPKRWTPQLFRLRQLLAEYLSCTANQSWLFQCYLSIIFFYYYYQHSQIILNPPHSGSNCGGEEIGGTDTNEESKEKVKIENLYSCRFPRLFLWTDWIPGCYVNRLKFDMSELSLELWI